MLVFFSFTACQSADSGQKGYFVEYEINAAQLYIDGKKISDTEYRALNAAAGELIRSIEREISVEFPDSDLSEINAAGAYELSPWGSIPIGCSNFAANCTRSRRENFLPRSIIFPRSGAFRPTAKGNTMFRAPSLLSCRSKSRLQAAIFPIWNCWTGSGCRKRTLRSNSIWAALPKDT